MTFCGRSSIEFGDVGACFWNLCWCWTLTFRGRHSIWWCWSVTSWQAQHLVNLWGDSWSATCCVFSYKMRFEGKIFNLLERAGIGFMVGSWSNRPCIGGIWRKHFTDFSFKSWTCIFMHFLRKSRRIHAVSDLRLLLLVCLAWWARWIFVNYMFMALLYSRMHVWWQVLYLMNFAFCKCTKSSQGRWFVRYGIALVCLLNILWSALGSRCFGHVCLHRFHRFLSLDWT